MLTMYDSIIPGNLPPGADAYLGYTDGRWPTYEAVRQRFPGAHVLSMAVFAQDDADGCDVEAGDLVPAQAGSWVHIQRQRLGQDFRPVVYASVSAMPLVIDVLTIDELPRTAYRLLSAHYGAGRHICGPATCAYPGVPACDGTQWTDAAPGAGGTLVDESVLLDDFFDGGNVALTQADADLIAKTLLNFDGVIPAPDGNKANPFWTPARVLADLGQMLRTTANATLALAHSAGLEPGAIAADVLKGLDPAAIASTIATALGPDVGQDVLDALAARLGVTPATP